jgi:hypothetical protein
MRYSNLPPRGDRIQMYVILTFTEVLNVVTAVNLVSIINMVSTVTFPISPVWFLRWTLVKMVLNLRVP